MTAKEYLIDKGIFSKHVRSGDQTILDLKELTEIMEGYAASKQLRTEEEVRERLKELNKNMKTAGVEWQKDYIRGGLIQLKWFLKE